MRVANSPIPDPNGATQIKAINLETFAPQLVANIDNVICPLCNFRSTAAGIVKVQHSLDGQGHLYNLSGGSNPVAITGQDVWVTSTDGVYGYYFNPSASALMSLNFVTGVTSTIFDSGSQIGISSLRYSDMISTSFILDPNTGLMNMVYLYLQ